MLATFWLLFGYILAIFWLHFCYIFVTLWLHFDYILGTFWQHFGYIDNYWRSVPLPCGQYRAIFWLATELCSNLTPISCTIINMWRLAIVIWNVFYHTNAADLKLRIWYEDICHQVSLLSELGQDKKTRTSSKSNILFYLLCTSEIITCLIVSGCKNNLVN